MLRSLIHLDLSFVQVISMVYFHSSTCRHQVSPGPFVEDTFIFPFSNCFVYLHSKCCPLSWSPLQDFFTSFPFPFASERVLPNPFTHPLTHPILPWGHEVSTGLSASSPTEARQGSPMLHVYWGWWTSPCMLFEWWLSLWELPGFQVCWQCWSSYGANILISSFNPFPNCSIGVPGLSPMVVCKYLHLS